MNARADFDPTPTVLERGWLSANGIVLAGDPDEGDVLIDSGHSVHAAQTVALVDQVLARGPAPRRLARLVNTHLHSDHCGGNAALQARWPGLRIAVPPGLADAVRRWDVDTLGYAPTGQRCDRYTIDTVLAPGEALHCGGQRWDALAAPGHDPHSLMLWHADSGTLVSADALWEHGFGVVFPELEGVQAFDEVQATLELIGRLPVRRVIPGHGAPFTDIAGALQRAHRRLDGFRADPRKHARYAGKVLVKYHLMEERRQPAPALRAWMHATPLMHQTWLRSRDGTVHTAADAVAAAPPDFVAWCDGVVDELLGQGALRRTDGDIEDV